jgi:membrane-bound lytic murein transglycosylase D
MGMGRNLLWRKIVKKKVFTKEIFNVKILKIFASCFFVTLFLFFAIPPSATEDAPPEYAPLPQHAQLIETLFFDRPLRHNREVWDPGRFWLPNEREVKPAAIDADGFDRELTLSFLNRYSKGGNKIWLLEALERGEPYMAFIKTRLNENNIPEELLYLPVIESAFVQTVVSRSGAAGLWQFMPNSMAPWLKSTDWVDERLDFWASTDAALAKLQSNYAETKDWPLALAAYNSGLGAIRGVIRKHPGKDYWELAALKALKSETLYYLPKLLAVSYIASNPRRTGFETFWPGWVEWEQIAIDRQANLGILAEIAGIDAGELRQANAELRYNTTPPDPAYKLKVRADMKDRLSEAIAQTEESLVRNYIHIISSGDTVYGLSRSYGVPAEHIFKANPGLKERALQIGSRLLIPALK